jgi:hypothetical protein
VALGTAILLVEAPARTRLSRRDRHESDAAARPDDDRESGMDLRLG